VAAALVNGDDEDWLRRLTDTELSLPDRGV
jgi:hypothetical protein